MVPDVWKQRLAEGTTNCGTYKLALALLHRDWKNDGRPVRLANEGLKEEGLDRSQKYRALKDLAIDGNIKARLGLPASFSFSRAEIRRFVFAADNEPHRIKWKVVDAILLELGMRTRHTPRSSATLQPTG
jgi:hypothetical protein